VVDKRTSALTAIAGIAGDDVIPVDDITDTTETRKITVDDLHAFNDSRTKILTNTTIDADGTNNSITNIENADIKAAAGIEQSKLALDITNSEINAGAQIDYSKLAALTDGNILVGNASNVPTSVNPTGDIDIDNAGVTSINPGVIVDADINGTAAIALSKLATDPLARANHTGNQAFTTITGTVPIAQGGSGAVTQQAAIDALTDVTSATNEHVLTKDTATGNAVFKAAAGGGGGVWSLVASGSGTGTKVQVAVSPNASALKLRIDISISAQSGVYHPLLTFNDNTTANARTALLDLPSGVFTTFTVERGCMLTRVATGALTGTGTIEIDLSQMVTNSKKTWRGTTTFGGLEATLSGSETRTAAITTVELVDQDLGANTVTSEIHVWELVP